MGGGQPLAVVGQVQPRADEGIDVHALDVAQVPQRHTAVGRAGDHRRTPRDEHAAQSAHALHGACGGEQQRAVVAQTPHLQLAVEAARDEGRVERHRDVVVHALVVRAEVEARRRKRGARRRIEVEHGGERAPSAEQPSLAPRKRRVGDFVERQKARGGKIAGRFGELERQLLIVRSFSDRRRQKCDAAVRVGGAPRVGDHAPDRGAHLLGGDRLGLRARAFLSRAIDQREHDEQRDDAHRGHAAQQPADAHRAHRRLDEGALVVAQIAGDILASALQLAHARARPYVVFGTTGHRPAPCGATQLLEKRQPIHVVQPQIVQPRPLVRQLWMAETKHAGDADHEPGFDQAIDDAVRRHVLFGDVDRAAVHRHQAQQRRVCGPAIVAELFEECVGVRRGHSYEAAEALATAHA